MLRLPVLPCAIFSLLLAVRALAATATGLSSFEAIEEPLVKFFPATGKFVPDDFRNIAEVEPGTFRMRDRFGAEWWDGDRDTENNDRQRAEVKGLGPHQHDGETFFYATTWRTNPEFRGTAGFCHVFQLKATNGEASLPLVTISIAGSKVIVEATPVGAKVIVRSFPWKPGTWQTVRLIIKTSRAANGVLLASVDGDPFQGKTDFELSRVEADEYRPKWGLYRKATVGAPMGDDYTEHRDVRALRLDGGADYTHADPQRIAAERDNAEFEREARAKAQASSAKNALTWLQTLAEGAPRDFALGSLAALWAETDPAKAMAWAEEFPRRAVRLDAAVRIFFRWADQDVTAAAAWLARRAPDPDYDEIAWLFATDTTYRYVNRRIALDGAALISRAVLRAAAFEHVVLIWARTEPAAAAGFLAATPALSAEQKQTIREKFSTVRARR